MKAAILHKPGTIPQYQDFPSPTAGGGHVLLRMRASSIKQLDLSKAAGTHYTGYAELPTAVGVDGVGTLPSGKRVYAMGITGMMAEEATICDNGWTLVPEGLSDALAAALPNALIGSDAALLHRARLQPGATVLVNGATGATGMVAVQVAKLRGAARVIATGRNAAMLKRLKNLGADETISLAQDDAAIVAQLQELYALSPIDIVLDYLWGTPISLMLEALSKVGIQRSVKVIAIGQMAGATIALHSGILRSKKIELLGSGIGALSMEEFGRYLKMDMPHMLDAAAAGKLKMDIEAVPLSDVANAWAEAAKSTKRIVLTMA